MVENEPDAVGIHGDGADALFFEGVDPLVGGEGGGDHEDVRFRFLGF